jgi:hypothetical protein
VSDDVVFGPDMIRLDYNPVERWFLFHDENGRFVHLQPAHVDWLHRTAQRLELDGMRKEPYGGA